MSYREGSRYDEDRSSRYGGGGKAPPSNLSLAPLMCLQLLEATAAAVATVEAMAAVAAAATVVATAAAAVHMAVRLHSVLIGFRNTSPCTNLVCRSTGGGGYGGGGGKAFSHSFDRLFDAFCRWKPWRQPAQH